MVQIFADLSAMRDGILLIGGEDYNHIRNVLRMHPGDRIAVYSETGSSCEGMAGSGAGTADAPGGEDSDEYLFEIVAFEEGKVVCRLLSVRQAKVELPVRMVLFQGLPKADKMDFIVQKAVEMGVSEIVPVEMHRSIVKLTGDKRRKRVARWQAIAEAAAKQSRRALIPQVHEILSMNEAAAYAVSAADCVFVPYERMAEAPEAGTRALLEKLEPGQTVSVFVGPEGGFEESEVGMLEDKGAKTISLGRRILRTETAALAFLSFLIYRFEL